MPKTLTLNDVIIREIRWSGATDAQGNPILHVSGVYMDDQGQELPTHAWHRDVVLDDDTTFSGLLGLTNVQETTPVLKDAQGKARAIAGNDKLKDGFGQFTSALKAKAKGELGV